MKVYDVEMPARTVLSWGQIQWTHYTINHIVQDVKEMNVTEAISRTDVN